jgi:hypothetical protein
MAEFNLTNGINNPTSPYATLSHTWGEDDENVTFEELKDGFGKTKTDTKSFGSVDSGPLVIAYNISRWTLAASTDRGISK